MVIPVDQLETWTSYETAAISSAKTTHERIRDVLEQSSSRLNERDIRFDSLLQGSYANDTIIRSSSDVDILIRTQDPFISDTDELSKSEKSEYDSDYVDKSYSYKNFRSDVIDELSENFGKDAVTDGEKAIDVECSSLPLSADVVPCMEYRYHNQYTERNNSDDYIEGIVFWSSSGERIRNYPEQHIKNATTKHQKTDDRFKPTARMFKNARNQAVDSGYLESKDTAPSYCVECSVWNVDSKYINQNDLQSRFKEVLDRMIDKSYSGYEHEHGLVDLFGAGGTQWSTADADKFLSGIVKMWDNW